MEFIVGIFLGVIGTIFFRSVRTAPSNANEILPKYITYCSRMSRLYKQIPVKTATFNHLVNVYGQNLSPEGKAYFNEAVAEYSRFWEDIQYAWDDLGLVANEMVEMFNEMEA